MHQFWWRRSMETHLHTPCCMSQKQFPRMFFSPEGVNIDLYILIHTYTRFRYIHVFSGFGILEGILTWTFQTYCLPKTNILDLWWQTHIIEANHRPMSMPGSIAFCLQPFWDQWFSLRPLSASFSKADPLRRCSCSPMGSEDALKCVAENSLQPYHGSVVTENSSINQPSMSSDSEHAMDASQHFDPDRPEAAEGHGSHTSYLRGKLVGWQVVWAAWSVGHRWRKYVRGDVLRCRSALGKSTFMDTRYVG